MTDQNEPSMEDILASIRSILADGEGEPAPAPAVEEKKSPEPAAPQPVYQNEQPAAKEPLPVQQPSEGVVNLTQDMIVSVEKNNASEEDDFTPEPVVKPAAENEPVPNEFKDISKIIGNKIREEDGLLSAPAVEATAASLSHLTQMFAADKNAAVGVPMVTLESIVRELLRPLLKEWLDQNLPDIVERVVRKEIARVTDRLDFK